MSISSFQFSINLWIEGMNSLIFCICALSITRVSVFSVVMKLLDGLVFSLASFSHVEGS